MMHSTLILDTPNLRIWHSLLTPVQFSQLMKYSYHLYCNSTLTVSINVELILNVFMTYHCLLLYIFNFTMTRH